MLQVYIEHFKDETVVVQSIQDDNKILSEFENGKIDLDVCIPYTNQRIKVHHNHIDDNKNSYDMTAILEAVEIDPFTMVKCIRYSPIGG